MVSLWDKIECFNSIVEYGMEVYVDNHPDGCECVEVESVTHRNGRFVISVDYGNDIRYQEALVEAVRLCKEGIELTKEKS